MSVIPDTDKVQDMIREVAEAAILPRFQNLQAHEIDTKSGPQDLVTAADIEAEAMLKKMIEHTYPNALLIGEESVARGEVDLTKLYQDPPEHLFIVDPVDGTWNFAHGEDVFCVMMAYVHKGQGAIGWIYDPLKETGMIAERGQGAYEDGKKLNCKNTPLSEAKGFIGMKYWPKKVHALLEASSADAGEVSTLRCAGQEYLRLCRGVYNFAIYTKLNPWDHLAGTLAVREAGGRVALMDGGEYEFGRESGPLITAASQQLWDDVKETFISPLA